MSLAKSWRLFNNNTVLTNYMEDQKYHFCVGISGYGLIPITSDKRVLSSEEATKLAMAKLGYSTSATTITSFTPISNEQHDVFVREYEEKKRLREQYWRDNPPNVFSESICSVQ